MLDFLRFDCEFDYTKGNSPNYGLTVACTAIICYATVFLEIVVHCNLDGSCSAIRKKAAHTATTASLRTNPDRTAIPTIVIEQPQLRAQPSLDATDIPTIEQELQPTKNKTLPDCCCVPSPSPRVRANRLVIAILFYAVILGAFIYRVHSFADPYVRPACRRYVQKSDIPGPNWWVVGLFNVLPFVVATFSLIRTVVDCWLVRYGRGLNYSGDLDWTTWLPCMPFSLLFLGVKAALMWPIALSMGQPSGNVEGRYWRLAAMEGDVEMQSEETRRLVDEHDEGESDYKRSYDGPPTYDVAVNDEDGARK
ncbi:hypothetical protein E8E13_008623 [Curvularia kusanoi]|uniref:Uncharacterized protein n=1 Tax=Curvularia kusanoi TaxID=90978 RepID=A0A9P4TNA9_CURKU|nr:hypothetical protein E8E13_008623 [Curvularia kusanoi]